MFAFKGQVPTLLEEELGLLRGRMIFYSLEWKSRWFTTACSGITPGALIRVK